MTINLSISLNDVAGFGKSKLLISFLNLNLCVLRVSFLEILDDHITNRD